MSEQSPFAARIPTSSDILKAQGLNQLPQVEQPQTQQPSTQSAGTRRKRAQQHKKRNTARIKRRRQKS